MSAIWHDIECGTYTEDLEVWRELARRHGGPILDIGAGTGRTSLDLARAGYAVTALDIADELLEVLRARGDGLPVTTIVADARAFDLGATFPLCIVPMQTVQLLGGAAGRSGLLTCARAHLDPGGALAIAITDALEPFEVGDTGLGPLPDVREIDGVVYSSRPTAVRVSPDGFVLERRRETVTGDGRLSASDDVIALDRVSADALEAEGRAAGLTPAERIEIPATDDYVGSTVVVLGG